MALMNTDTEMRLKYLASERGCHLDVVYTGGGNAASRTNGPATGETLALTKVYNGTALRAAGASLATVAGDLASVDPTITSAT